MQDRIDKTKENLGLENLDNETKKELFGKFVDAGGEVISEKQKRKSLVIDREKQRQFSNKIDSQKKKSSNTVNKRKNGTTQNSQSQSSSSGQALNFFTSLKLRFLLWFKRISQFNGLYFSFKFLERFNNLYKPSLIEIQVAFLELFKKDPKNGRRIIQRLDQQKPIYYEIIEMVGNIYDKMITDQIVDHYVNFPDVPKKVSELKDPLMILFRQLYILKPYENLIFNAFERAMAIDARINDQKSSFYSSIRKKVKNGLFISFHKLYPRLHLLFIYYGGTWYDQGDPSIEDIFNIKISDKPGNRTAFQPVDMTGPNSDETDTSQDETETKEEESPVDDSVKKGLDIMYNLNIDELLTKYDKAHHFEDYSSNDKVIITYALFSEFVNEYASIMTTNKIKFNVDFENREKIDYKNRLRDFYDEMRKASDILIDYADKLAAYEKTRKERPMSSSQYIQYAKRLEAIKQKRDEIGRMARMNVKAYMDKIMEEFKILINDMDSEQRYISNPQDVLKFSTEIEGNEKINNIKVFEAFNLVYYYAAAFAYRLSHDGDLSGDIDKTEEVADPETLVANAAESTEPPREKPAEEKKSESNGSILDELDDML